MKTRRRWAIMAALFLAVITVVALWTRRGVSDVSVASVTRDTLSVSIAVEGRTRARDSYTVTAPVSGRLARLDLKEGDTVSEGQLLARLVPVLEDTRTLAALQAEVEGAKAYLLQAEAHLKETELQYTQAEREVARRRPLLEIGAMTREAIEQAELAAVVAEQRRDGARATATSADAALAGAAARLLGAEAGESNGTLEILVRAPVSGRVLAVPDESERVVGAGATLMVMAGTGALEVVLDVLSEDAVRIVSGQRLLVTRWGGDRILTGTVSNVTMAGYTKVSTLGVEEQRVDVIADIHHPPPTLGTGYRVSGEVVVWEGNDVLVVPTSAVFRVAEQWRVFVIEGDLARTRGVVIGQRNPRFAEIIDGLEEGDLVILFPSELISDGVRVRAQYEPGSTAL